jgi:hypothetical protein
MVARRSRAGLLGLLALVGACRGGAAEPDRRDGAPASPGAATGTVAAPAPSAAGAAANVQPGASGARPDGVLDLGARFQREAALRPGGTPTVEDAFAAIERKGFKLDEQRQHLASPFNAAYCVGAKTTPDIALSVCEHASAEAAAKGRDESAKLPIPNRTVHLRGATTLTVRLGTKGPEGDAAAKAIVGAFEALAIPKAK